MVPKIQQHQLFHVHQISSVSFQTTFLLFEIKLNKTFAHVLVIGYEIIFNLFQTILSNMSPEISSEPKSKRRRIMVISGDDSVTDQIEKMNDMSLCQSILLDTLD